MLNKYLNPWGSKKHNLKFFENNGKPVFRHLTAEVIKVSKFQYDYVAENICFAQRNSFDKEAAKEVIHKAFFGGTVLPEEKEFTVLCKGRELMEVKHEL